ncbi:MAG TPA: ribose-phosphate pyrophosphokinase [Bacillota bacterium]
MSSPEWKNIFTRRMPIAPLGIIPLASSRELAGLIDQQLLAQRRSFLEHHPDYVAEPGFMPGSFLIPCDCIRFADGSGKAVINQTVRGSDIYIIADVGNYNCRFKMFGLECPMSPDDHFQDIKRVIAAIGGRARRITVIMPLLYGGRQHRRQSRESLDCAVALQDLERLKVDNIFTFDAHDSRVQNAIPLTGFNNLLPSYQILKTLLEKEQDVVIDKSQMLIISPDEGGMSRSIFYANVLGLNVGLFYKRRDYTRVVNGKNPIIQHEFLGEEVEGKDVLIVDDMIASGESILDIAKELKRRKARRIFFAVTFALFTEGLQEFREGYQQGLLNRVYATNLTFQKEDLKDEPWFVNVDMSQFIAYLLELLNHDQSISSLFDPSKKISEFIQKFQR